ASPKHFRVLRESARRGLEDDIVEREGGRKSPSLAPAGDLQQKVVDEHSTCAVADERDLRPSLGRHLLKQLSETVEEQTSPSRLGRLTAECVGGFLLHGSPDLRTYVGDVVLAKDFFHNS